MSETLEFRHNFDPRARYLAILGTGPIAGSEAARPSLADDCGTPLPVETFKIAERHAAGPQMWIFPLEGTTGPVTARLEGAGGGEDELRFGYPVRQGRESVERIEIFRREKIKLFAPHLLAGRARLSARLAFTGPDGAHLGTEEKAVDCPGDDGAEELFLKFDVPEGAVRCEAAWQCDADAILARLPVFLVNYCSFGTRLDCPPLAVPVVSFAGTARDARFGRTVAVRFGDGTRILRASVHGFEAGEDGWFTKAGTLKTEDGVAAETVVIPTPADASEVEIRVTLNPKARFTDPPEITLRPSTQRMTATSLEAEARTPVPAVLISTTAGPFRDDILRLRSHFIAELFARRGFSTQYVALIGDVGDERPFPNLRQSPKRDFDGAVWRAATSGRPGIYVCSSFCDAAAVMAVDNLKRKGWFVVYEVRDDMEAMRRAGFSRWYNAEFEKRICRRADLVICVSRPIREKMLAFGAEPERTIVIPNGIFRSELAGAEANWDPAGRGGRDRVGYFGHMFPGRFDVEIIRRCATGLPDIGFDLVGPGLSDESLMELPNVTCHGQVTPSKFFAIAKSWDVGILPFQSNRLTHALDPIKHYQYLAAGLKVVSTEVANLRGRPMTRICGSAIDFPDAVAEQLAYRPSPKECCDVLSFLENSVWEKRFDDTLAAIERFRMAEVRA